MQYYKSNSSFNTSVKMVGAVTTDLRRTDNENRESLLKTSVLGLFDQHSKRSPASIAAEFQGQTVT